MTVRKAAGTRRALSRCALAWLAMAGACRPIEVRTLYAVRVPASPSARQWSSAIPLLLKAGGGNVHGRNERLAELALDTDAVHGASASCHHGPPVTDPVPLELRAFYSDRDMFLEVRWEDRTADRKPKRWHRAPGGWLLGEEDEDGVALIWNRTEAGFGCQEACHMSDYTVRRGELIDLRSMTTAKEGEWEEAWVWKAAQGAQALRLEHGGFVLADDGSPYRTLNSAVAVREDLPPEARRAGTFGGEDRPLWVSAGRPLPSAASEAPAYLYAGSDGGGSLRARAERLPRGWRVVFSRPLSLRGRRQEFGPGERLRFGIAVFDATSTNHHLARDIQTLELAVPPATAPRPGEEGVL